MENTKKGFQAMKVNFKDPETGEDHNEFFVSLSSLSHDDFDKIFQGDHPAGECIFVNEVSQIFSFEDMAAYPEFKELIEAIAEGMEESSG